MAADNEAEVQVRAEVGDAMSKFGDLAKGIKTSSEQITKSFDGLSTAAEFMKGALVGAFSALAGGAIIRDSVAATQQFTGEAVKLGRQLGVTATEAATMAVALDDVHSSVEDFGGAATMLSRQVRTNEDALKKMGLQTRDSHGELRGMKDLMLDAIKVLNGYKEGTDRNLAGQVFFGRGAANMTEMLKLNEARLVSAKEKQEALGLTVGVESVQAYEAFRDATNDVGDVLMGMKKTIGDAFIPVLTKLSEWFAVIGPGAITVIKGAVGGLVATFWSAVNGVTVLWETINAMVTTVAEPLRAMFSALWKAVHGDFAGAKTEITSIGTNIAGAWKNALKEMEDSSAKTAERIKRLFSSDTPIVKGKGGGEDFKDPKPKGVEKSRMSDWKAQLDLEKEATGLMLESKLQLEEDFWKKKLILAKGNKTETIAVERELYNVHKQMAQEKFAVAMAGFQFEMEKARQNWSERARILRAEADLTRDTYGAKSKQYTDALRAIEREEIQHQEFLRQMMLQEVQGARDAGLRRIELERQNIDFLRSMEQVSELTRIARLRELEQQSFQVTMAGLQAKREANLQHAQELKQIDLDIAAAKAEHERSMVQNTQQTALAIRDNWLNAMSLVTSTVSQSVTGIITGVQTWGQAVKNLATSILATFVDMAVKILAKWIATKLGMQAIDSAAATKEAAQNIATITQASIRAGALVADNAAAAASGAYAATAVIPVVGPELAPAAAASAYGGAMAYMGTIAFARGGYDIPSNIDPMVQAHRGEMVLPQDLSDGVRNMVDSGGSGGGRGTVVVQALDGQSVEKFLKKQGHRFADALLDQARNFRSGRAT